MILEYAQIHAPHIDQAVALLGREAVAKAPQKPHSTETAAPAEPQVSGQVIAFPRKKG